MISNRKEQAPVCGKPIVETGGLLGPCVAEQHGIICGPTRQLAANLYELRAIDKREILDRFLGQAWQHLDGDEATGRRAGNLHALEADDFWTKNVVPMNASLPRKA